MSSYHVILLNKNITFVLIKYVCLLFYTVATVFQSYHGGDMMYEMRRKLKLYTFTDSRDLNSPHHTGMVGQELAFDYAVSYTVGKWISAAKSYSSDPGFAPLS